MIALAKRGEAGTWDELGDRAGRRQSNVFQVKVTSWPRDPNWPSMTTSLAFEYHGGHPAAGIS
jgi:hypothetical protein